MGYITVHRKGYTRSDGTRVKATTYKMKDRGAKGKGKKVISVEHPGSLTALGYHLTDLAKTRRSALLKALKKVSYANLIRKLNAIKVWNKRTNKTLSEKVSRDMDWLRVHRP